MSDQLSGWEKHQALPTAFWLVSLVEAHTQVSKSLGTPIGLVSSGWNRDQGKVSAMASHSSWQGGQE